MKNYINNDKKLAGAGDLHAYSIWSSCTRNSRTYVCTWFLIKFQTSCSTIRWSTYMTRRPHNIEILIEISCWNNRSYWNLNRSEHKKSNNKTRGHDFPVIVHGRIDSDQFSIVFNLCYGDQDDHKYYMSKEAIYRYILVRDTSHQLIVSCSLINLKIV